MATNILPSAPTRSDKLSALLLSVVDLALAGVVFALPLFMGGWHPVGHLAYVALVVIALSAWCVRQTIHPEARWRLSGIELVLIAGTAILVLQVITLPPDVVVKLSPLSAELLPLWSGDSAWTANVGHWTYISLMPEATRRSLVLWMTHAALFLVVVQRIQAVEDVERFLRWIAMAAVGMSILGLAQFLFGNGKFLWMYEHPYRDTNGTVKGTFANQNHLANFMALGIGPLLWWLTRLQPHSVAATTSRTKKSRDRQQSTWFGRTQRQDEEKAARIRLVLYFGIGAVSLAGLLTFSRGGVLVLFIAAALSVVLLAAYGAYGRRSLVGLGVAAVVVVAAMFVYGYGPLASQLATLTGNSERSLTEEPRWDLWMADMQAFARAPLLGTGAGSHAEVYPTFFPHYFESEFTQAESGYIQVLLETGVAGTVVLLFLWAYVLWWIFATLKQGQNARCRYCAIAIGAGLIVSLLHSIWDFVWFMPGCMALVVVLAGCACRLWQLERPRPQDERPSPRTLEVSRFPWAVASLLAIVLGAMTIHNRVGPAMAASGWERFLALQQVEKELGEKASTDALMAPIADSLRNDPQQARVHVRMAAVCLRKFEERQQQSEVPLPLSQIRDAARVSQFSSLEEQEQWLARVLGENRKWLDAALRHARRAVALCPLQGEAYTLLAELSFLDGPDASPQGALINQALRVRPYEAHVLFAAGRDAVLIGQLEQALALWKSAFHQDPNYRKLIIAAVAPQVPAEEMLAHFQPDVAETRDIFKFYREGGYTEQAKAIAQTLARKLEQQAEEASGNSANKSWHEAYRLHAFLGDDERALACIRRAVEAAPFEYDYRRDLATQLLEARLFEEALIELRWCRQRNRYDPQLEKLWEIAKRGPQLQEPVDSETVNHQAAETAAQPSPESLR